MVPMPPHKTCLNWNVYFSLKCVQEVSQSVWLISLLIVVDDHIGGSNKFHQENRHITYKEDGDIFQMYAIYDHGFTYALYIFYQHPKKTPTLDSYIYTFEFLVFNISCVTTSISLTLIICT